MYPQSSDAFGGTDTGQPWPMGAVAALRHEFRPAAPVVSARLYATAFGAYKFYLNGAAVGDQRMAPGWMDYREHMPYQVYDVTAQVRAGDNAIAALLAPGLYSTPLRWFRQGNTYGTAQPSVRAQLRLEHADGSVERVATDESWKADTSATIYTDNLRTAKATDHCVLAGGKAETYEPLFTFHGFRYAEISGMRGTPNTETLKAVVLHTDAPMTARFATGDTMVNKLWSAGMGRDRILWACRRTARKGMSGWDGARMHRCSGGRRPTTWT